MAYILSLATASPNYCFKQEEVVDNMIKRMNFSEEQSKKLKNLYDNSSIHTRFSVLENFDSLYKGPTSKERNEIYKKEAPKLALKAAKKALAASQENPQHISHIISVSCTGMMAPGIECHLIKELGLSPTISRLGINFMGCFGAFNGISVANALAKENPKNRILLVCTELCSLHAQLDLSSDTILANSLFADGAGACVIGDEAPQGYLWEITRRSSHIFPDSNHFMSWDVGDSGYTMKLSARVPVLIKNGIKPFVHHLLEKNCAFEECSWAIHPGGKSIIQAIEKGCDLQPQQTSGSWETLRDYGNMSSATFLFVLEKCIKLDRKWTVGIAFGPGLSMEGLLMKR